MHSAQALEALWDHDFEHTDQISQNTSQNNLGWRAPLEVLTGGARLTSLIYLILDNMIGFGIGTQLVLAFEQTLAS
jgi:hypothetical protein